MIRRIVIVIAALSVLYIGLGFAFEREIFFPGDDGSYEGEEEAAIKDTVVLYNKILSDIYASGGVPARLNDFPASKQLRHELFRDIGFLRGMDLIMVYDMADIVFMEIKMPSPTVAEAITFEEWNYLYQRSPSREVARSIRGLGQGFKYLLVKQGKGWIIVDYIPLDVEYEREDEFYY